jgi:hypothetical protein
MKIRGKSKQTENDVQVSFVKIGGLSFNLRNGQMDSLLSVYFYLKLLTSEMYEIQRIIAAGKNGYLKRKVFRPLTATFGFKSLVL